MCGQVRVQAVHQSWQRLRGVGSSGRSSNNSSRSSGSGIAASRRRHRGRRAGFPIDYNLPKQRLQLGEQAANEGSDVVRAAALAAEAQ